MLSGLILERGAKRNGFLLFCLRFFRGIQNEVASVYLPYQGLDNAKVDQALMGCLEPTAALLPFG